MSKRVFFKFWQNNHKKNFIFVLNFASFKNMNSRVYKFPDLIIIKYCRLGLEKFFLHIFHAWCSFQKQVLQSWIFHSRRCYLASSSNRIDSHSERITPIRPPLDPSIHSKTFPLLICLFPTLVPSKILVPLKTCYHKISITAFCYFLRIL
jgi:hypothetical protein